MAFVEFRDVRKVYRMGEVEVAAVDGMTFDIERGRDGLAGLVHAEARIVVQRGRDLRLHRRLGPAAQQPATPTAQPSKAEPEAAAAVPVQERRRRGGFLGQMPAWLISWTLLSDCRACTSAGFG